MSTMKDVYYDYYPKLIRVLPMDDAIFTARLYSSRFLPGDAKEVIQVKSTRAEKTTYFLDNCIAKGFDEDDDDSNPLFTELLDLMEKSDDITMKKVAQDIKRALK